MHTIQLKTRIIKSEKGTSMVIFAVSLTFIAACAALTIDIGAVMMDKSKLSAAVDAAALAGVQELISDSGKEEDIVNNYMAKNIGTIKAVNTDISAESKTVAVSGTKTPENYFLKIVGLSMGDINASATAKAENITSLSGARPFAVIEQTFAYGTVYTLKEGAGGGTSGNYAAMDLGGGGGNAYGENLLNGYSGIMRVGDEIPTETGNIAGKTETGIAYLINQCSHTPACTYDNYNPNCTRIVQIPVVKTLNVPGKKDVKIVGFASFFLEGTTNKTMVNGQGQIDVVGRFITYNMEGETSSEINDYGTYGIRLIK